MKTILLPIINIEEYLQIKTDPNIVLVDVRSGENGKEEYLKEHLEGAIFLDLETDLSDIKEDKSNGGRHPLPSLYQFSKQLGEWGITPDSHVIVYDNNLGAMGGARFWWMLRAVGHTKIQLLNGGFSYAQEKGLKVEQNENFPTPVEEYHCAQWRLPTVTIDEVENATKNPNKIIIDVRSRERYLGITEPIDLIAGHIPNAINIPFMENLDSEGLFLAPETLLTKYKQLYTYKTEEDLIFHCGSGVSACHSLIALAHAGLPIPSLYVGSWGEWSRNNKEIIVEQQ